MNKKWRYKIGACLLPLAILAGCGDGSGPAESDGSVVDTVEPVNVAETPEPTPEQEETPKPEEAVLQYQTGNLTEEEQTVMLEAMTTLRQNLEIPEYLGEGIHMVSNEEWLDTLCQGVYEGSRSYTLQKGTNLLLVLQIGYDIQGEPYANVFCPGENGEILVLKQAGKTTWLLQTAVTDGKYEGEFEIWQFDGETGYTQWEQGTYAAGIIVGEYKKSEYTGGPGEAFDIWTNRENFPYKTTTVTYDENGEILPTPTPDPTAPPKSTPPPQSTPTPTPPPAPDPTPTPPPAQQPTPPPTQAPTPQPTPEPTPTPTPEPPPEPSMGGDSDIDWGPDMD